MVELEAWESLRPDEPDSMELRALRKKVNHSEAQYRRVNHESFRRKKLPADSPGAPVATDYSGGKQAQNRRRGPYKKGVVGDTAALDKELSSHKRKAASEDEDRGVGPSSRPVPRFPPPNAPAVGGSSSQRRVFLRIPAAEQHRYAKRRMVASEDVSEDEGCGGRTATPSTESGMDCNE
jgi:hypothetical protein